MQDINLFYHMQPLLTADEIRKGDQYTIKHEPISSIDLMERAAVAFVNIFIKRYSQVDKSVLIFCGTGNNGGDGLAIARLLTSAGYENISVIVARFSEKASEDFDANLEKLTSQNIPIIECTKAADLTDFSSDLFIDAILGSGLNKPLTGEYEILVEKINSAAKPVISVDIPTGLPSEGAVDTNAVVIRSTLTVTFQQPKISFLLPESKHAIKEWIAVDIGISQDYLSSVDSHYQLIQETDIKSNVRPREKFSNKGSYGHALIIAGRPETMGAALLCSSACAHAGAGLTTACIPQSGLTALNSYQPEVMAIVREDNKPAEIDWQNFKVIGIGPGLGKDNQSLHLLMASIKNFDKPIVIDADALNMLANHQELLNKIPKNSIFTPHVKEFDRLFGEHASWWDRLQTGLRKSKQLNIYIVLKNDYTITISPEGKCYFNATSNAAMASGGMGDVLTGIITAFAAQGYSTLDACLAGVYLHGKAGDDLALPNKKMVVLAGDVLKQVPESFAALIS